MRVLFITNIPSPYRVNFFNELGKYCDLCVLFEKAFSDERNEDWKNYDFDTFKGIILKGISTDVDKAFSPSVVKYIRKYKNDIIVVANTITPTGMLEIAYMKAKGIRYYLEADGAIYRGDNPLKKQIKTFLMSKAGGYFSSAASLDDYFCRYGAEKRKIFRYPFSSIYKEQVLGEHLSYEEKNEYKKELSIKEEGMVLFVGQFIHRKGIDVLLKSWGKCILSNCGLYLIGGNLSDDLKKIIDTKKLKNVHVISFIEPKELSNYYKAADVFVLPTREDIWGLVINEAMSYGLPVITTKECVAGLEMVQDGVNGYLVESENEEDISSKISMLMKNKENRKKMAESALISAREYTIEKMSEAHIRVFNYKAGKRDQNVG